MSIKMKRFLSILLSLALMLGLLPGMSLTAYATTYSGYISDDLQAGDILKPGARISAQKINVTLQANGWGSWSEVSTSVKQFSVEMRSLEISKNDNGSIRDNENKFCYPYANGEKVSAWVVVSFNGGEYPSDPKTITLTGYAPPTRTPVTEISSDMTLTQNISGYVTITGNVTLDLAGYTITGGGNYSTIIINNGYTLTLIDSSTGKTGKITGGGGDAGGGVAVGNNATFNMQGGTISGNTATNGGGVALGGDATFTMSGGTITGNSADNGGGVYSSGSSFSMTGGMISNNSAGGIIYGGGGVLIQSGNFSMSGTAAITGNDGGGNGGGVYFGGSTFTMSGGSISGGNHASSGGGVYVKSGTFNMTGGTITGNSTDDWAGGGVYTCSIFNMSGSAAITGNSATTEGGGVYQDNDSSAVFTMTGGSITNNSSGSKGYAGVCIRQNGTFNLSGGAVIDGNTHGSTEEDICLYPGSVVKVTGALTMENTMSVRLTDSNGNDNGTGTIAQGSSYTLTETDGAKFIASTTNRRAKYDSENSKEILVALYTVTYNANGATSGTVPTDENTPYESGSTVTVLGNTGNLAKTSHNFNGWNTAANGSGTPYAADATFNIERSTTLYAQWEEVTHAHDFTYYASGATITATCTADGCTLPVVEGKHTATLTIAASGGTYDGTTAYGATITDDNSIQGDAKVQYQKKSGESYGTATETAPTDAGDYKASITLGGVTASVEYTIAQADPTANAPTGLTATYGKTLADVSLEGKNPEGNTLGSWAWADAATTSVGSVGAHTFKANFTPTDTTNYNSKSNVDVTVTVGKADNPATVTSTATVTKGGNTVNLADNVTKNGATGDVGYAIDGETKGCTLNGSVLTSGDTTGTVTVNVTVATDDNYNALAATPITVTISDKGTQTITAENVTATYGDTDKSVSATVTDPATGGGAISYAVKDGSGDYIDVDAASGALTIKKVPADGKAYVTVTAAETATYAQATKEVAVTINKAAPTVTAPTAKTLTYNGQKQELVNAGSTEDGTLYYAVTTENTAPTDENLYTTSIPTKTDAGTYYVWYKAEGDANHNDSEPGYVTAVIKAPISATVTFKVANGSWDEGEGEAATADKTVTLTGWEGDTLKLAASDIPSAGTKPGDGYKEGGWEIAPVAGTAVSKDTTYTYKYAAKVSVVRKVTFKVENGAWDNGNAADVIVTLEGLEGDVLKLPADKIPAVGKKPAETYKAGKWDKEPVADTEITADTAYTYTYAKKASISAKVTFKVENGAWDDGNAADITVTLEGLEGDTLKLPADKIPAVGKKPAETYKAGAWDKTPVADTEITADTTYTYNYAEKDPISATVTFKVVNGSWDDGTTEDLKVTVAGFEGDQLYLAVDDVPDVGNKPAEGYAANGKWDTEPSVTDAESELVSGDPITKDTTYTYTYEKLPEPEPEPDPDKEINGFVTRLYKVMLGREPDPEGLKGWTEALKSGKVSAAEIVRGFACGEEFILKYQTNAAIVRALYLAMLDREPDPEGLDAWANVLATNPVEAVIKGLCGSMEFGAICKKYGIEPGTVDVPSVEAENAKRIKIEAFVKRCYYIILSRLPDEEGLKGWSDALQDHSAHAARIIEGFVCSDEFMNKKLSNEAIVKVLYRTMLDRTADEEGLKGWTKALDDGYKIQHIINRFCGSAEFTKICSDYGIQAGSVAVPARASAALEAAAQLEAKKLPDERIGNAVSADDAGITVVNGYEPAEVEAFVKHAYRAALGREADEAGLVGWTEQIVSGAAAPKAFLRTLLFSDEQIARKLNNEQFIEMLYRLYLNRGMDDAAAERIAQLAAGGLDEVIKGFEGSAEFRLVLNGFGL